MIFQNAISREQSINEAIVKWKPFIKNMSYKLKNNILDYDDLFNEAVRAIIRGIDAFNPTGVGSLDSYLYRCISNEMRSAANRTTFALSVPSGSIRNLRQLFKVNLPAYNAICGQLISSIGEESMPYSDSTESYIDLLDLIQSIDTENILYMYWIEEKTYKEISAITKKSISTICRIINRGKNLIQLQTDYNAH